MRPDVGSIKWLLAEYCAGPFYMGWWLYLRDRSDGSQNDDRWDRWGWLRDEWQLKKVHDFLVAQGHDAPPAGRYCQKLAEWFGGKFPGGLRVRIGEWGRYEPAAEREGDMGLDRELVEDVRRLRQDEQAAGRAVVEAKATLAERIREHREAKARLDSALDEIATGSTGRGLLDTIHQKAEEAGPAGPPPPDEPPDWRRVEVWELLPGNGFVAAMLRRDYEIVTVDDLAESLRDGLFDWSGIPASEARVIREALVSFRRARGWPDDIEYPDGFPAAWLEGDDQADKAQEPGGLATDTIGAAELALAKARRAAEAAPPRDGPIYIDPPPGGWDEASAREAIDRIEGPKKKGTKTHVCRTDGCRKARHKDTRKCACGDGSYDRIMEVANGTDFPARMKADRAARERPTILPSGSPPIVHGKAECAEADAQVAEMKREARGKQAHDAARSEFDAATRPVLWTEDGLRKAVAAIEKERVDGLEAGTRTRICSKCGSARSIAEDLCPRCKSGISRTAYGMLDMISAGRAEKLTYLDGSPMFEAPADKAPPPAPAPEVPEESAGTLTDAKERIFFGPGRDAPADLAIQKMIRDYRARQAAGDVEPRWGRWSEMGFSIGLGDAGDTIVAFRVLYEPPTLGFGTDHLEFHWVLGGSKYRSHFIQEDRRAGLGLLEYATLAARHLLVVDGHDCPEDAGAPAWRSTPLGQVLDSKDARRLAKVRVRTAGDAWDEWALFGGSALPYDSVPTSLVSRAGKAADDQARRFGEASKGDIERMLLRALDTGPTAAASWDILRRGGATDEEIGENLGRVVWLSGQSVRKAKDYATRGGPSPAFWVGAYRGDRHAPTLAGAKLIEAVRFALQIPTPERPASLPTEAQTNVDGGSMRLARIREAIRADEPSPADKAQEPADASRAELLARVREAIDEEEGPAGDGTRTRICSRCRAGFAAAFGTCPSCAWNISRVAAEVLADLGAAAGPRPKHEPDYDGPPARKGRGRKRKVAEGVVP